MYKLNDILDKIMNNNLIMVLFYVLTGVVLSNYLQYEVISDFQNYHYYVPWAFFNDRTFTDIAVGGENSYHNPLIEIPAYFIINHFNESKWVLYTYHGIFFGLLIFIFYKLILLIFNNKTLFGKLQVLMTLILVFGGFSLITQIGTSSNEIQINVGIFAALYILYRELFVVKKERLYIFFVAAVIMGAMLGLKLTAIVYCLAMGFTLIFYYKHFNHPLKVIGLFILGGFTGFCLTHGYWSYMLYKNMENPMFPYMNNIFKSPYYNNEFLTYKDFYKKSWLDYLIFPFIASFQGKKTITSEVFMIDIRLAAGYLLLIFFVIKTLCRKNIKDFLLKNNQILFLVVFVFLSYIIWLYMFAIIRYAIPIEMLISVFIVKYVSSIRVKSLVGIALYSSFCIVLIFMLISEFPYKSWGSRMHTDKIIESERIMLPENTLILAISPWCGLGITQIIKDNPTAIAASETSIFTLPGEYYHKKIEEYKQNSAYIAYVFSMNSYVSEFDKNTPTSLVYNEKQKEAFQNLDWIIKTELGADNFYCRTVIKNLGYNKTFVCIDKKDKYRIFPEADYKSVVFKKKPSHNVYYISE